MTLVKHSCHWGLCSLGKVVWGFLPPFWYIGLCCLCSWILHWSPSFTCPLLTKGSFWNLWECECPSQLVVLSPECFSEEIIFLLLETGTQGEPLMQIWGCHGSVGPTTLGREFACCHQAQERDPVIGERVKHSIFSKQSFIVYSATLKIDTTLSF